jgi:hypothetical protein
MFPQGAREFRKGTGVPSTHGAPVRMASTTKSRPFSLSSEAVPPEYARTQPNTVAHAADTCLYIQNPFLGRSVKP